MSTTAYIGRPHGEDWIAVYHHFDGYPEGLGLTLVGLLDALPFSGDYSALVRRLIDEEPVGWSTIVGADFTLPNAFTPYGEPMPSPPPPQSYTARGERPTRGADNHLRGPVVPGHTFLYLLHPDGIEVHRGEQALGLVAWGDEGAMRGILTRVA